MALEHGEKVVNSGIQLVLESYQLGSSFRMANTVNMINAVNKLGLCLLSVCMHQHFEVLKMRRTVSLRITWK